MSNKGLSEFASQRPRDQKTGLFLPTEKNYEPLLKFESVRCWIEMYQSHYTQRNYLRALKLICESLELSPDEILEIASHNGDKMPLQLKQKFIRLLQEHAKAEKSGQAKLLTAALRSFLAAHEKTLFLRRAERVRSVRKKVAYEYIPTREEVYKMADAAEKRIRDKAMILCHFQSGVRPGCLLNWNVGLVRTQLYPEIKVPISLKTTPQLDPKISSYGLDYYYTFLQKEAAEALRSYLDWRMAEEGSLPDSAPIFVSRTSSIKGVKINVTSYWRLIKKYAHKAGLPADRIWPHCIRKSFRKVLNASQMDDDTREALMGHKIPGSRENYFDRHDLGEIEEKYARCLFGREVNNAMGRMALRQMEEMQVQLNERDTMIKTLEERLSSLEKAEARRKPADETMSKLLEDPEVQRTLAKKLRQLGVKA